MHILVAMNARQIIDKLKEHALSEYAIAKKTQATDAPVSQSTINRIATGETVNPSYGTWQSLMSVLAEIEKPRSSKRASSALNA